MRLCAFLVPAVFALGLSACGGKSAYEKLQNDPLIAPPASIVHPFGEPVPALGEASWLAGEAASAGSENNALPLTGWLQQGTEDTARLQALFTYLNTEEGAE